MEQNFEKLEELIKDDDKIATVASFAVDANISIAESKEIIEKFVEINKGSRQINVTYILNGKKKDEDYFSVCLIKEGDLEEGQKVYEDGVTPTIFSIQKAKNVDFNIIALVDPVSNEAKKDPLSGSIIGKNCNKRVLRKKELPSLPPSTVKGKSTINIFSKQKSAVKSEVPKVEKDNGDSNQNNKNTGVTQGNLASLFNKAASNKKSEQKDEKPQEKKQKSNGGITNFFTKQSSKDLTEKVVQNHEIKKEKQDKKEGKIESKPTSGNSLEKSNGNQLNEKKQNKKTDSDTDDEILKDLEIKEPPPERKANKKSDLFDSDTDEELLKDIEIRKEKVEEKNTEKKKGPSKTSQNKNKNSQKKKREKTDVGNEKSAKKRKRIIVEDESDSDDIFGSEKSDNEDLIEKSDEEGKQVKVQKKPLAPKNKRRKAVEKTYEDEDGYIVTKTEYVYETASEDENEPENKIQKTEEKPKLIKKGSSNSENDISPNKGSKSKKGANKKAPAGNQPTLMNFLKKK